MKCTYTMTLFSDEAKTKILYEKTFEKLDDIIDSGFIVSKSLLYKITSGNYKNNTKKFKYLKIKTERYYKNRDNFIHVFG